MDAYSLTHGFAHMLLARVFNWLVYFGVADTVGFSYCSYYDIHTAWRTVARWILGAQMLWISCQLVAVYLDYRCGIGG